MDGQQDRRLPEVWGGVECTVNRVGDNYFDQLERSGHRDRLADLDRFASLGFKTLRYPILLERVAPNGLKEADWTWPDQRVTRLRELGITPIAGLVHHGSGPRHTSLLDPSFPLLLAEYAGAVARATEAPGPGEVEITLFWATVSLNAFCRAGASRRPWSLAAASS